jgi:type VI secretion system secreted protein Hcp
LEGRLLDFQRSWQCLSELDAPRFLLHCETCLSDAHWPTDFKALKHRWRGPENNSEPKDKRPLRSGIKNPCLVIPGLIGLKTTDANAAVDMVLCINGVAGSTTDTKNDTGCIDVLAWSWGVSNSTIAKGQGGKASFSGISITKSADNSSAYLLKAVASGELQPAMQLRVRKSCGVPDCPGPMLEQYTIGAGAAVNDFSTGGSGGEDRLTENVSLNLPDVDWCFAILDPAGEPTGSLYCDSWIIVSPP